MEKQKIESFWSHLHCLVVLAEQGSYTKAAIRLNISKASVSQKISVLEKAAGISLVARTTRSVRLTDAGRQLVDDVEGPFEQITESLSQVRNASAVPFGLIRVTAPVAFSRQQLVPRLSKFLRANPRVRVQLEVSDRVLSLAAEGFDLAVRHVETVPDTHVAWPLCRTHSVLVASPAYISQRGLPRKPADLESHDFLYYPRGVELPTWTFESLRTSRVRNPSTRVAISGPFATNNSESLRDASIEGLGIAMLPDFSAQAALRSGDLVRVLPDWKPTSAFAENLHLVRTRRECPSLWPYSLRTCARSSKTASSKRSDSVPLPMSEKFPCC